MDRRATAARRYRASGGRGRGGRDRTFHYRCHPVTAVVPAGGVGSDGDGAGGGDGGGGGGGDGDGGGGAGGGEGRERRRRRGSGADCCDSGDDDEETTEGGRLRFGSFQHVHHADPVLLRDTRLIGEWPTNWRVESSGSPITSQSDRRSWLVGLSVDHSLYGIKQSTN